ncbi:MAG: dUTP diphosphatase [bacterium]|nr:dUTP diphosphatase [bacterium]
MQIMARKLFPDAQLPVRASEGAVGYDVFAHHILDKLTQEIDARRSLPQIIPPGESILIGIGVALAVPFPYDCQVRPRSGLASRHDIELSNAPGTVDPDYRGEASILLRNRGSAPFTVGRGMRIAQLVFTRVEIPEFVEVTTLPPTVRDAGGFGSTGFYAVEKAHAS